MNIALLGPQGSGKGTQGELLAAKTGMYYFDAGAYLRQAAKTNKELDEMVNKKGVLIPDDMVYKIVRDHFIKKGQFDNIIFDGYPRSVVQWNLLSDFLSSRGASVQKVIFLSIPEDETITRLSARRMDPETGHIYNLITNPPPADVDQTKLLQREDDTPDAIKVRLASYHASTEPLIQKVKEAGKLIEIDGTLPINQIEEKITSVVQ